MKKIIDWTFKYYMVTALFEAAICTAFTSYFNHDPIVMVYLVAGMSAITIATWYFAGTFTRYLRELNNDI